MIFEKLASAIRNNVISGLQGYHTNVSFTKEQIEDDIVDTRLQIIAKYSRQGLLPIKDFALEINCIEVDCKDIEKCSICSESTIPGTPTAHFEIPLTFNGLGSNAIIYIGSTDKQNKFRIYTSLNLWNSDKYKRRKKNTKPYVWIDTTPNENGMYDCFIFNAPLLKEVSVIAIFKDPRQLEQFGCCGEETDDNFSPFNLEIKLTLTEHYLRYYRLGAMPPIPNNQQTLP